MKKIVSLFLTALLQTAMVTLPVQAQNTPLKTIILPFENITGQAEHQWIGKSFSEKFTAALIPLAGIDVLERTQIESLLKEQHFSQSMWADIKNTPELGKMAGADRVLLGSYEVVNDQLSVHVRLVDVETGRIDKTIQLDTQGNMDALFALQRKMVQQLTRRFASTEEKGRLMQDLQKLNLTDSLPAHRAYIEAVIAHAEDDIPRMIRYCQTALEQDAQYVLPHLLLSNALSLRYTMRRLFSIPISPRLQSALKVNTAEEWLDKARGHLATAKALLPEHKGVRVAEVNMLYAEGKKSEALARFRSLEGDSGEQTQYANLFLNLYFDYGTQPTTSEALDAVYASISPYLEDDEVFVSWVGLVMKNEQKTPEAVERLLKESQQRLAKQPQNVVLRLKVAEMQQFLQRHSEAIKTLDALDQFVVKSPLFYSVTGALLLQSKAFKLASKYADKALAMDPKSAVAQSVNMVSSCAQKEAQVCYSRAKYLLRTSPDDINALVFSSLYSQNLSEQERNLTRAIRVLQDPAKSAMSEFTEADLMLYLAISYDKSAQYAQAFKAYQEYAELALTPDEKARGYSLAAGTYYFQPGVAETVSQRIQLLEKALALPVSQELKTKLLLDLHDEYWIYREDGKTAHQLIQQALLSATPAQQQNVILKWAELLLGQQKIDEAENLLKTRYTQTGSAGYFRFQSDLANARKDFIAAARWYKKFLDSHLDHQTEANLKQYRVMFLGAKLQASPNNPDIMNDLGTAFLNQSDYASAEYIFQNTLSIAPDNATVHYNLGTTYVLQEQWAKAIAPLQKATTLRKDYRAALYNLGLAHFKLKQLPEARQVLLQLKLLQADYPGLKELLPLL